MQHARRWATPVRTLACAAAGLLWAVLWAGFARLEAPPAFGYAAAALLVGPVVASTARDAFEAFEFLVAAFLAAVVSLVVLAASLTGRAVADVDVGSLLWASLAHWVVAALVAYPVLAAVHRYGRPKG